MKRRKFVIGLGASAIGGSLAVSSSAFTSTDAQRDIELNIVPDSDDAYLELTEKGGGGRSLESGGQLRFYFPGQFEGSSAEGLGRDSVYQFEHDTGYESGEPADPPLFFVRNQGTNTLGIWGEVPVDEDENGNKLPDVKLLDVEGGTEVLSENNPAVINPGDELEAGLQFDTHGVDLAEELTVPLLIRADENIGD